MTTLQTFTFADTNPVRVHIEDGVIEFCARDVCNALGYANAKDAIAKHCKGIAIYYPLQTAGGVQGARFIGEADLYRLIMRSNMESAVAFQDWIVEDVLPTLRRTGTYTVVPAPAPSPFELPKTFSEALRLLADSCEQAEALKLQVEAQRPAVEFVESYVHAEGTFGLRETAKLLGVPPKQFTDLLQRQRLCFRENGHLQPYAEHLQGGYFTLRTGEAHEHAFTQTRVTPKGVEWLRRRLGLPAQASSATNILQLTA